ncbi:hypothetical protein EYD10_16731 [Varanus komodoensis]|nr:hypothetical protein EYD10_16731 [Varanus komodoensis]
MSAPVPEGKASSRGVPVSVGPQWEKAPAGPSSRLDVGAARRSLKIRNAFTALGIGAIVLGIYGYTFYSVSQERFLDELELETKVVRAQAAKTAAD